QKRVCGGRAAVSSFGHSPSTLRKAWRRPSDNRQAEHPCHLDSEKLEGSRPLLPSHARGGSRCVRSLERGFLHARGLPGRRAGTSFNGGFIPGRQRRFANGESRQHAKKPAPLDEGRLLRILRPAEGWS